MSDSNPLPSSPTSNNPQCEACGGAGWLRGRELMNPSDDTYDDSMTKYTCDRCGGRSSSRSSSPTSEGREEKRRKHIYIGAPACFALELAIRPVLEAFDALGCYVVGSALKRQDWRDVDLRMILTDEAFSVEFPDCHDGLWEMDARWLLLTVAISEHLSKATGLPIDFQIQPQSHANKRHDGPRSAIGLGARLSPTESLRASLTEAQAENARLKAATAWMLLKLQNHPEWRDEFYRRAFTDGAQ